MTVATLPAEWQKYLIFIACSVGLYWLMRRISASTGVQYPEQPRPGSQVDELLPPRPLSASAPPLPPAPELGPIRIRDMYFTSFDLTPGPADPARFSDELFLRVENADTGFHWTQSFQVATAAGLADTLAANGWQSAYIDSLILVTRYDLVEIWRAVVERLVEDQRLTHAGDRGPPVENGPR